MNEEIMVEYIQLLNKFSEEKEGIINKKDFIFFVSKEITYNEFIKNNIQIIMKQFQEDIKLKKFSTFEELKKYLKKNTYLDLKESDIILQEENTNQSQIILDTSKDITNIEELNDILNDLNNEYNELKNKYSKEEIKELDDKELLEFIMEKIILISSQKNILYILQQYMKNFPNQLNQYDKDSIIEKNLLLLKSFTTDILKNIENFLMRSTYNVESGKLIYQKILKEILPNILNSFQELLKYDKYDFLKKGIEDKNIEYLKSLYEKLSHEDIDENSFIGKDKKFFKKPKETIDILQQLILKINVIVTEYQFRQKIYYKLNEIDNLKSYLTSEILFQDKAIEQIIKPFNIYMHEMYDHLFEKDSQIYTKPSKPLLKSIVSGPFGVGKKSVEQNLGKYFGFESLIIDFNNYQNIDDVNQLFSKNGVLAEFIKKNSGNGTVLIFENATIGENEKNGVMKKKLLEVFLSILDEGKLKTQEGEILNFTNTMIFINDNSTKDLVLNKKFNEALIELEEALPLPELNARIPTKVLFNSIEKEKVKEIINHLLKKFNIEFKTNITISDNIKEKFRNLYKEEEGILKIKNRFNYFLKDVMNYLIEQNLIDNKQIQLEIDYENEKYLIKVKVNNKEICFFEKDLYETTTVLNYQNVKFDLAKIVIGQNNNIGDILKQIQLEQNGFKNKNSTAVFSILAGPTGVGKTMITKTLASQVQKRYIKIDMSLYKTSNDIKDLIEILNISQKEAQEGVIIVFDEIEKAHEDMLNVLSDILDRGEILNIDGDKINLKNSWIFLTTNAGREHNFKKKYVIEQLFENKPEIKNKIDIRNIQTFNPLNLELGVKLLLQHKMKQDIKITDNFIANFLLYNLEPKFGIRVLIDKYEFHIKDLLYNELKFNDFKKTLKPTDQIIFDYNPINNCYEIKINNSNNEPIMSISNQSIQKKIINYEGISDHIISTRKEIVILDLIKSFLENEQQTENLQEFSTIIKDK